MSRFKFFPVSPVVNRVFVFPALITSIELDTRFRGYDRISDAFSVLFPVLPVFPVVDLFSAFQPLPFSLLES